LESFGLGFYVSPAHLFDSSSRRDATVYLFLTVPQEIIDIIDD
jgi:hypothetical protein